MILLFKNSEQIVAGANDRKNTKGHKAPDAKEIPVVDHIKLHRIGNHKNKPASYDDIAGGFMVKIYTPVYKTPKADIHKRKNIVKNIVMYAPPGIRMEYNYILIYSRQSYVGQYSK